MIDDGKCFVRTIWGPRRESPEQCARRAGQCMTSLGSCDEVFSHWTRNVEPFAVDCAAILESLREQEKQEDFREDSGYTLFLAGGPEKPNRVELSIHCSSYYPMFVNLCTLTLPGKGPAAERLIRWDVMSQLLGVLASAWEPDFGEVLTAEFFYSEMDKQIRTRPECPLVGWMVYLSNERGPLPAVPPRFSVLPVGRLGKVAVTTKERFSHERGEHVQAAQELRELLNENGLLGPITTVTM